MGRFWVLGPVTMLGREFYGVVDSRDVNGRRPERKPKGYQEFWPTEAEANAHRDKLNEQEAADEQRPES